MILVLAALMGLVQSPPNVDEMRAAARDSPDSVLVDHARHRPDDVREVLRGLLASAAREPAALRSPAGYGRHRGRARQYRRRVLSRPGVRQRGGISRAVP